MFLPPRHSPVISLLAATLLLVAAPLYAQEEGTLEAQLIETLPDKSSDAGSRKIIDYHLRAVGGEDKLRVIKSLRLKYKFREGKNETDTIDIKARPNFFHLTMERSERGRPNIVTGGFNGELGWTYHLSDKRAVPKKLPENISKDSKEAYFISPFIDWEERGYAFEYEGEVKSKGRKHYLLKMYYPSGKTEYLYFDAKTLLITRVGKREIIGNSIVDKDYYNTKYENIDGVWLPVFQEMMMEGQKYGEIEFTSVELNPQIEPGLFDMPEIRDEVWLRKGD